MILVVGNIWTESGWKSGLFCAVLAIAVSIAVYYLVSWLEKRDARKDCERKQKEAWAFLEGVEYNTLLLLQYLAEHHGRNWVEQGAFPILDSLSSEMDVIDNAQDNDLLETHNRYMRLTAKGFKAITESGFSDSV